MNPIDVVRRSQKACAAQPAQIPVRRLVLRRPKCCGHSRTDDRVLGDGAEQSEQPLAGTAEISDRQKQRRANALFLCSRFITIGLGDEIVVRLLQRLKTSYFCSEIVQQGLPWPTFLDACRRQFECKRMAANNLAESLRKRLFGCAKLPAECAND